MPKYCYVGASLSDTLISRQPGELGYHNNNNNNNNNNTQQINRPAAGQIRIKSETYRVANYQTETKTVQQCKLSK